VKTLPANRLYGARAYHAYDCTNASAHQAVARTITQGRTVPCNNSSVLGTTGDISAADLCKLRKQCRFACRILRASAQLTKIAAAPRVHPTVWFRDRCGVRAPCCNLQSTGDTHVSASRDYAGPQRIVPCVSLSS
jgi:hypothetical protein